MRPSGCGILHLIARSLVLRGHSAPVESVAYSPDGRLLISAAGCPFPSLEPVILRPASGMSVQGSWSGPWEIMSEA